jgi:hypothetical protein
VLREKLIAVLYETRCSVPYSQEVIIASCHEPDEFSPHPSPYFCKVHLIMLLSVHRSYKWCLPFVFSDQNFVCIPRISMRALYQRCKNPVVRQWLAVHTVRILNIKFSLILGISYSLLKVEYFNVMVNLFIKIYRFMCFSAFYVVHVETGHSVDLFFLNRHWCHCLRKIIHN